jgi:hypothetical protein
VKSLTEKIKFGANQTRFRKYSVEDIPPQGQPTIAVRETVSTMIGLLNGKFFVPNMSYDHASGMDLSSSHLLRKSRIASFAIGIEPLAPKPSQFRDWVPNVRNT